MKIKKDFIGMFDVLKGVLMILIITVHTLGFTNDVFPGSAFVRGGLWLFKYGAALVGMFFVFAGYGFRPSADGKKFVKKQAKQFLVPYAVVIVLSSAAITVRDMLLGRFSVGSVSSVVLGGLFGSVGSLHLFGRVWLGGIVALWFLLTFFFGSVIYNFTFRLKNEKARCTLVWLLTALAVAVPKDVAALCPWTLVQSCASLGFMEVGRLLKKQKVFYKKLNPVFAVCALALWAVMHTYSRSSVGINEYRFLHIDYICAVMAAVVFIKAYLASGAAVCDALAPLEYVGRYSLWFFCIHSFELLAFPWNETAASLFPVGISPVWVFIISDALRIAFAVLVCMGINYLYGKILLRRY